MAQLSKGIFKEAYKELGGFLLLYITILMSENTEFVFLSENESDILIAETPSRTVSLFKDSYIEEGTYARQEL